MQFLNKILCPFCAAEFVQDADTCVGCGRDLRFLKDLNKYQLVRDGNQFGIALRGRMVLGKMELKEAQNTLALVNGENLVRDP